MKKIILSLIFAFAVLSAANAYVSVEQPENLDLLTTQKLQISVETNESILDFSMVIPNNVQVQEYALTGAENYNFSSTQVVYLEKESTAYLWSFKDLTANNFEIELTLSSETTEKLYSVWIYPPTNFDSQSTTISKGAVKETSKIATYVMMVLVFAAAAILVYYLIVAYKRHNKGYDKV